MNIEIKKSKKPIKYEDAISFMEKRLLEVHKKKSGELVGDILIKSSSLKPIKCPAKLVPSSIDEFPLLFITASVTNGVSEFNGISELRHKESDRIKEVENGLKKIGIKTKSNKSTLKIFGNSRIKIKKLLTINPQNDHRIAMALSVMASVAKGSIKINNSDVVAKSYSNFYKDLEILSA